MKSFYRPVLHKLQKVIFQQNYQYIQPGVVGPSRTVPDSIQKPPYADTGEVPRSPTEPEIKTADQIAGVRSACQLARYVLDKAGKTVKPGMTTDDLDAIVHHECIVNNAYPSPLNYKGFPKSVCTSVNNVLCHGIPDDTVLQDGDIINIDVSVFYNGFHGDTSETYMVGNGDKKGQRLLNVGKQCLHVGIDVCKPGVMFCDIGKAISAYAKQQRVSVVPQIIGHGIGSYFHGPPDIFNCVYESYATTQHMAPGMTFTIEPIVCEGSPEYVTHEDNWTLLARDNSRSCQFEHTVLITKSGADILTQWSFKDYGEI